MLDPPLELGAVHVKATWVSLGVALSDPTWVAGPTGMPGVVAATPLP